MGPYRSYPSSQVGGAVSCAVTVDSPHPARIVADADDLLLVIRQRGLPSFRRDEETTVSQITLCRT